MTGIPLRAALIAARVAILAGSPLLEIRFVAPLAGSDKMDTYAPQFGVTTFDTKTHVLLWTLAEPVQGAFRRATFEQNLGLGMEKVIEDLKKLISPETAASPQK